MALNTQNVTLRISAGLARQFPGDPLPQVAFSGRSNVGKSSLINTLLSRKSLARVSAAPGKTITVNFYDIDKKLFFVDLPGYGYAKRTFRDKQQWSALTEGYFTKNPNLDRLALVFQLVDSRVGITEDDALMLRFLRDNELPFQILLTKSDKLNQTERRAILETVAAHPDVPRDMTPLFFSSLKGEGKQEVWRVIAAHTNLHL